MIKPNETMYIIEMTKVATFRDEPIYEMSIVSAERFETMWKDAQKDPKTLNFRAYRITVPSAAICRKDNKIEVFDARKGPDEKPPKEGIYR